ncbi:MAG: SGNH/GDSL hydrolase family protein [Saprospiraceae bacterium]
MRLLFIMALFLHIPVWRLQAQQAALPVPALRIAVIGSSTAAGTGASTPDSAWVGRYRAYLQGDFPGSEVLNLGKGGYSGYQLLPDGAGPFRARPVVDSSRNISKAIAFRPHAVIVNLPSNDTVSGHSAEEQLDNLEKIALESLRNGAFVWVCTTQPRNLPPDRMATQKAVRDGILQRFGPFAIDLWTPLAAPNDSLSVLFDAGDGVHLNDDGHAAVFNQVVQKDLPGMLAQFWQNALPAAELLETAAQATAHPVSKGCFGALAHRLRRWGRSRD